MRFTFKSLSAWGLVPLLTVAALATTGPDLRLIDAVKNQDRNLARTLIAAQVDVNTSQADGATAFHWAMHWGDIESARLLMNSKSSRFPNGLANGSGMLGRYLTDSTGLTVSQTLAYVVLPQAVRNVLPDLVSNTVEVVKLTSIASVVALPELLYSADMARSVTFNSSPLVLAALIYLVLLWPVVRLVSRLERRIAS